MCDGKEADREKGTKRMKSERGKLQNKSSQIKDEDKKIY